MIGTFTATQFIKGINLANLNYTPQYRQARAVQKYLQELWQTETEFCTIRQMDYYYINDYYGNEVINLAKKHHESIDRIPSLNNIHTSKLVEKNLINKSRKKGLKIQLKSKLEGLFWVNKPIGHRFLFEKL